MTMCGRPASGWRRFLSYLEMAESTLPSSYKFQQVCADAFCFWNWKLQYDPEFQIHPAMSIARLPVIVSRLKPAKRLLPASNHLSFPRVSAEIGRAHV